MSLKGNDERNECWPYSRCKSCYFSLINYSMQFYYCCCWCCCCFFFLSIFFFKMDENICARPSLSDINFDISSYIHVAIKFINSLYRIYSFTQSETCNHSISLFLTRCPPILNMRCSNVVFGSKGTKEFISGEHGNKLSSRETKKTSLGNREHENKIILKRREQSN